MKTFMVLIYGIGQFEITARDEQEARIMAYLIHYKPVTCSIDEGNYNMMLRYTEVIA